MSLLKNGDNVVVIGAGSIGLSTAYNLANLAKESSLQVKIHVLDAFDAPFSAASSTNTGCLHYGFAEPELKPMRALGKYSFDLWADEAQRKDFVTATGYRAQSFFGIVAGSGHGLEHLPDWVQTQTSWNVNTKVLGSETAMVYATTQSASANGSPSNVLARGVVLRSGARVVAVDLSQDNKVQNVTFEDEGHRKSHIQCSQVLLACGPWTPTAFQALFPSAPIRLQWTTNAGDWIVIKDPCPTTPASTAFVSFESLVGEKLEFAGRQDGTIWLCGRRNFSAALPPAGEREDPDNNLIAELKGRAQEWLNLNCQCEEKHGSNELQILRTGRSFRPAVKSGLPVISAVTASDLAYQEGSDGQSSSTGLFICWGHGSYGLTLGMGSGRLMSQLMLGRKPDLDLSLFPLDHNCD